MKLMSVSYIRKRFRTELNYIKDKKELVETLKELDKYMDGDIEADKEFENLDGIDIKEMKTFCQCN